MDGIIPYVKVRNQGPLGDEDWATLQEVVENVVENKCSDLQTSLDSLGLSVVSGKLCITYNE